MSLSCSVAVSLIGMLFRSFLPSFIIRAKDETVWVRMKEKGNKGAGRTGPDDGIGGEWSRVQGGSSCWMMDQAAFRFQEAPLKKATFQSTLK